MRDSVWVHTLRWCPYNWIGEKCGVMRHFFPKGKLPFILTWICLTWAASTKYTEPYGLIFYRWLYLKKEKVIYLKLFIARIPGPAFKPGRAWFFSDTFSPICCILMTYLCVKWLNIISRHVLIKPKTLWDVSEAGLRWKVVFLTGVHHRTPVQVVPISKFSLLQSSDEKKIDELDWNPKISCTVSSQWFSGAYAQGEPE